MFLYNPVALSYLTIKNDSITLYINRKKLTAKVLRYFQNYNVNIKGYFDIYEDIKHIEGKVLLDTKSVNYALVSHIHQENIIDQTNPSQLLKSIKNETEIKATKDLIYMMVLLLLNLCIG